MLKTGQQYVIKHCATTEITAIDKFMERGSENVPEGL